MAQTRMELRLAARRAESLLITAVVPLLLLVFFGSLPILPSDYRTSSRVSLAWHSGPCRDVDRHG